MPEQSQNSIAPNASPAEALTYPLSFSQRRLWFLDKLDPGSSVYNLSQAFRLKGHLDSGALERSVNQIVRRHESLRTTFPDRDGNPLQVVAPSLAIRIPVENLTGLAAPERERAALRRIGDLANQPYDLERGPLIRVALAQIAGDEYVVLFGMHHIISDGWSMGIFLDELSALYNAEIEKSSAAVPELPIQYGDYAAWLQDWMQGEVRDQLLEYWTTSLKGAPAHLEVPADRIRPPQQTYRGSRESCHLPWSLRTALSDLSRSEGATLFMTLFTAFNTLLARYTSQEDMVLGVSVAGRASPETHQLIGFFVNTLALRTDLSGDPSFRDLLRRTVQNCLDAYEHEDLPYEVLVEALNPERSLAYPPLFQVMFAYQNAPGGDLLLSGLQASAVEIEARTSMFDITMFVWETPDGMRVTLEYNTDLFDAASMRRLLGHFEVMLEGVTANPDTSLSRLPLLSAGERRTVLVDWNNTAKSYPDCRMHQLFEKQAEKSPDAPALIFRNETMTFAELNRRANQLAHLLVQRGVTPGDMVGVCMERSFEMVIALYGIIKAGAAYVPYDPEFPLSRLSTLFQDSSPVCLVAQQKFQTILAAYAGPVILVDRDAAELSSQPASNLDLPVGPQSSIYAIYTSGSTGLPKAAVNAHAAVVNRILWMDDEYRLTPADRIMQKTPYTFDVSVWEFFWPTITGAALVIAEPGGHRDPAYLAKLISEQRVTTLHFVPSMLREFLDVADPAQCGSVKRVICSGEALPPDLCRKFHQLLKAELHNLYGPTEAAVDVTYWDCSREAPCPSIPIGRPIANATTYILDQHLAPVPIGVPGDLYLGGVPVGKGYLNRPELTQQRFIPDPFSQVAEARLYRTGDRARYLPDGNIEYLGRNDNQVKLRGLRIELGEIESTLLLNSEVRAAAIAVRQDHNGDKALVAYVVPAGTLDPPALKAFLKERLPEYMVPAHFVLLDALPMLSNGKLDRNALPEPACTGTAAAEFAPPRTPLEQQLVAIWERLLNRRPIGISDNYFDLGGHSLMAVRLFSSIKTELGIELPLATLYQAPTIETLAQVISEGGRSVLRKSLVPINPAGRRPPLYCVSGIGGGVLVFRDLAVALGEDQPFYALQPETDGTQNVVTSIAEMASHYIQAIQEVQPDGPYYLSGYSFGGLVAFEMAQQLTGAGFEIAFLGLFDTSAPLRVKSADGDGARRTYGTAWQRLKQILTSANAGEQVLDILRWRWKRLRARAAEKLHLRHAPELATVFGSQAFAGMDYVGKPYSGSITLFRSQIRDEKELWSYTLGWENLVSNIEVRDIAGNHTSIYSGENIGTFAGNLASCLEAARCSLQARGANDQSSAAPPAPVPETEHAL